MTRTLRHAVRWAMPAVIFLLAVPASAQVVIGVPYGAADGLPYLDLLTIITDSVRAILGVLGFFLIIQTLHGWFTYQHAGGKADAREAAMAGLKNSVGAFVVVIVASSATHFIVNAAANAVTVIKNIL